MNHALPGESYIARLDYLAFIAENFRLSLKAPEIRAFRRI